MKTIGDYIGHYRLISQQAQGETSAYQLYRVESTLEAENPRVLKTWPGVRIISQTSIDAFTRQAQALVDFHAPFFLPIRGYGIDDSSHPYLILPDQACTLETLAQRMERNDTDPMLEEEATTILQEVGTALVAAHQQSIVHGYLSPKSILLTPEDSVLIADFAPSMVRTTHQRLTLKPAYRPPEMHASRLSDQYALGALARELRLQLTASQKEAIARAQNEDPARRFSTVRAFLQALGIDIPLAESEAEQETRPAEPLRVKRASLPDIPWSRIARSKATRWSILAALLLLFLLGISLLYTVLPASAAIVTIVPISRSLQQSYQLRTAVQTNIAQQQVRGRELAYTTSRQSMSASVENQGQVNATQARGKLVFSHITREINLIIPIKIDLSNGLTLVTVDTTDMQPGFTYTIHAQIKEVGSKGNIAADVVDGFYNLGFVHQIGSPPDFFVSNPQPFTGGKDLYDGPVVGQSDADGVTLALEAQLRQQAQQSLQPRLQPGEALLDNLSCSPVNRQVQPAIGQPSTKVTVTESMSCAITAYDRQSAYDVALNSMKQLAARRFGSSFVLLGQLHLVVTSPNPPGEKSTDFGVNAQGLWRLLLDAGSRQLVAQTIAGKSQAEARSLLLTRFAARATTFSLTWWWGQRLPANPSAIQIVGH